ncbi:MAG TPA: 2-succinyl-5-enolpyruvyl-6-hydroxy-3-cyclohexene-1-carboxylate synthase, partial [Flavobacterium sp.]|nr:2-succinyl-5-enolpyruvyl-6-hydroxy-3-cyclohexene-1-carboxylate synthase [Flavobacterium sp.]
SSLANMFELQYFEASSEESLIENWTSFIHHESSPAIFEIFTPEKLNDKILLNYFKKT